jgi:hypothetical protein
MHAAPRFQYYEQVCVVRPRGGNRAQAGRIGVVLGRGDAPGLPVTYGVLIEGEDRLGHFAENELEATGRRFTREEFYGANRRGCATPAGGAFPGR